MIKNSEGQDSKSIESVCTPEHEMSIVGKWHDSYRLQTAFSSDPTCLNSASVPEIIISACDDDTEVPIEEMFAIERSGTADYVKITSLYSRKCLESAPGELLRTSPCTTAAEQLFRLESVRKRYTDD
ncbi:RICIN domain-containing protein [Streptomyces sp. NPDC020412]|uniref:RICIN domain-containing protein n=1 Tax=Streptomyces sp. NPDC020412 TaxID=3365073 RepID=UPI0037A93E12